MSQLQDIHDDFGKAIRDGVGSEEGLLKLKLEILESLEWYEDAYNVADELVAKGYEVESHHLRNFGK